MKQPSFRSLWRKVNCEREANFTVPQVSGRVVKADIRASPKPPVIPAQYFGRCELAQRRACSIGARGGCAARNRFIVGKASIRSRQAQIAGCFGYMVCASGVKPKAWIIGSM